MGGEIEMLLIPGTSSKRLVFIHSVLYQFQIPPEELVSGLFVQFGLLLKKKRKGKIYFTFVF